MRIAKRITVDEYTTPCPQTVSEETPIKKIVDIMKKKDIRHIPVVKNGMAIGIISDRDLFMTLEFGRELKQEDTPLTAFDIMTIDPYTVSPETSIDEVTYNMSSKKFGSSIVQYENGEIGIFTSTDALNALIELSRNIEN